MTVELLQTLSLVSYIAAGVFFLVAIALFFLLDVPKLYGDISGKTAKKAIEAIRRQNESSGNKANKPSQVNAERGKITDKISPSGNLKPKTDGLTLSVGTEKFATSTLQPQSNETTVLEQSSNETTVLEFSANETTVLEQPANETTVLSSEFSPAGETTVLSNNDTVAPETKSSATPFAVDVEMSFSGSSEMIE